MRKERVLCVGASEPREGSAEMTILSKNLIILTFPTDVIGKK